MDDDHAPLLPSGARRQGTGTAVKLKTTSQTNVVDATRREKLFGGTTTSNNRRDKPFSAAGDAATQVLRKPTVDEELKEQDELLSAIHGDVLTVGELAKNLDNQLSGQNRLLMNIEVDMHHTLSATESITRRTTTLVNASGGPRPFCIICFLTCIALFLFMLIIYL